MNLLRLVAEEIIGDRHRHQHKANREQHLIKRAGAVKAPIQRSLQDHSEKSWNKDRDRQCREKGNAGAVHQQRGAIAAEHGESSMRQIDEIHQPESHRKPDRKHEKQHAIGDSVEQDRQHARFPGLAGPVAVEPAGRARSDVTGREGARALTS
jgi:hypothetical protein